MALQFIEQVRGIADITPFRALLQDTDPVMREAGIPIMATLGRGDVLETLANGC